MGCVYAYVIVLTFVGPENLKKEFGVEQDEDMAIVAGHDTIEAALHRRRNVGVVKNDSAEDIEKGEARTTEVV